MVCGAAAEEQNKCSSAFGRVEQASCRDTQARFTHATSPAVYIYDAQRDRRIAWTRFFSSNFLYLQQNKCMSIWFFVANVLL